MSNYKNKKGLTLIELIITLGLIGIIMALVFFFFNTNQKTLGTVGVKSDLQYEAKVVIEKFSKYAMEAASANVELDGNGKVKNINFTLVDDSGNKIEDGAIFTLTGTDLLMQLDGQPTPTVLCQFIDSFEAEVNQVKGNIAIVLKFANKGITYSVKENYLFRNSHIN